MDSQSTKYSTIVVSKLREINSHSGALTFFGLLKELIETTQLSNADKRLVCSVRKDKCLAVSINQYRVIAFYRKKGIWLELLFRKTDKALFDKYAQLIKVQDFSSKSDYFLAKFEADHRYVIDDTKIMSAWQSCLEEVKANNLISPYRKNHVPFLYEIAENEQLKNEILWEIEKSETEIGKPLIVEEKLPKYHSKPPIPLNCIYYGSPGTGKTYQAQQLMKNFDTDFITFHQSFSYEEFIEGIRPITKGGQINYVVRNGIFKNACLSALQKAGYQSFIDCIEDSSENRKRKFQAAEKQIFIIDEINRANISKVFGELITLIEPNKRLGNEAELWLTLPYSNEKFGIPSNLYLVGTMNSSDRSIALLDTALRRRFDFIEMQPNATILPTVEGVDLANLLQKLNHRIKYLLNKNYQLGHAYFIDCQSVNQICHRFSTKIIPLLEEYFQHDYQKIQWIVGNEIIKSETYQAKHLFNENLEDLEDEKQFFWVNEALMNGTLEAEIFENI